jgi:hypothetical protein
MIVIRIEWKRWKKKYKPCFDSIYFFSFLILTNFKKGRFEKSIIFCFIFSYNCRMKHRKVFSKIMVWDRRYKTGRCYCRRVVYKKKTNNYNIRFIWYGVFLQMNVIYNLWNKKKSLFSKRWSQKYFYIE